MQEDLSQVKSANESLHFKLESLKYDFDLLKEDIVRQRTSQKNYLEKVEGLEKRLDSVAILKRDQQAGVSNVNFMDSNSRLVSSDRELPFLQRSPTALNQNPQQTAGRPANNFERMGSQHGGFMEEGGRMSITRGDLEAGNISIIERGAIGTRSSPRKLSVVRR